MHVAHARKGSEGGKKQGAQKVGPPAALAEAMLIDVLIDLHICEQRGVASFLSARLCLQVNERGKIASRPGPPSRKQQQRLAEEQKQQLAQEEQQQQQQVGSSAGNSSEAATNSAAATLQPTSTAAAAVPAPASSAESAPANFGSPRPGGGIETPQVGDWTASTTPWGFPASS